MKHEQARIALNLCDEIHKLHDLLWDLFFDEFMDLIAEKNDIPVFDDSVDNPF